MQLKSILFGFGLGLIFLSAIVLLAHRWENRDVYETNVQEIDEERIIEQAAQLGMVWPTDDS